MRRWVLVALAAIAAGLSGPARADDPPPGLAEAQAMIGRNCANAFTGKGVALPGFNRIKGFSGITVRNGFIEPQELATGGGGRVAFLLRVPDGGDLVACRIADAVALPSADRADSFLQCFDDSADGIGFGLRHGGRGPLVAYWSIDRDTFRLIPGSAEAAARVRCRDPETGE